MGNEDLFLTMFTAFSNDGTMGGYYSDNEINDDKSPIEEEDGILNNDKMLDNAEEIILEEELPKDSSEVSLEKNETFIIFDQALHREPDSLISSDSINGTELHNMTDNELTEEFSQD